MPALSPKQRVIASPGKSTVLFQTRRGPTGSPYESIINQYLNFLLFEWSILPPLSIILFLSASLEGF